jgi:hypothetical protein
VGKTRQGFEFLGYHVSEAGITVAATTVARCVARIRQLYERERGGPRGSSQLGVYVSRWWRWAEGGGTRPASVRIVAASLAQLCQTGIEIMERMDIPTGAVHHPSVSSYWDSPSSPGLGAEPQSWGQLLPLYYKLRNMSPTPLWYKLAA